MFGVLTAIALTLMLQTYMGVQSRLGSTTLFDSGVTALNEMTREIRMAGYPSRKCFSTSAVTASPGLVATPFVTVTPYDLTFQADIDGDGTVEQIEYVNPPQSENLLRTVSKKNLNGSLATSALTTLAVDNIQNRVYNQSLFTWDVDPSITEPFPLNVRAVYINLVLQAAGNGSGPPDVVTLMATCPRTNF
jgi:Tfp pilus assembly protein PilW